MKTILQPLSVLALLIIAVTFSQCNKEKDGDPPEIRIIFEDGFTADNDTCAIGVALRFRVEVNGKDAPVTNFTVKKHFGQITKTVLDSGMSSSGFLSNFTFYQGVEEVVEWKFSVLDRNRKEASVSLMIYKDPLSQFGGIVEYKNIRLGYQDNNSVGHFFLSGTGNVFFMDSASLYPELVDVLTYFNLSEDQGVLKPSPTFSSPGEVLSGSGILYDEYYPDLLNWSVRNYTKYDIRVVNGVTPEAFGNAHNDSLLIVAYDDVWGKKKYKWATAGTFIPFMTAGGKKGIIHVLEADHQETGSVLFSLKIQL